MRVWGRLIEEERGIQRKRQRQSEKYIEKVRRRQRERTCDDQSERETDILTSF